MSGGLDVVTWVSTANIVGEAQASIAKDQFERSAKDRPRPLSKRERLVQVNPSAWTIYLGVAPGARLVPGTGSASLRMPSSGLTNACDHGQDRGLSSIRNTGGAACGATNVA